MITLPIVFIFTSSLALTTCQAGEEGDAQSSAVVGIKYTRYADHSWNVWRIKEMTEDTVEDDKGKVSSPSECGMHCLVARKDHGCRSFVFHKADGDCRILKLASIDQSVRSPDAGWSLYIEELKQLVTDQSNTAVEQFRTANRGSEKEVQDESVTLLRCLTATQGSKFQIEIATFSNDIQLGVFFKFDPTVEQVQRTQGDCSISPDEVNIAELPNKKQYTVLLDHQPDGADSNPREEAQSRVYKYTHEFSGEGQYVIVFDNTFSRVTNKWVYYKVQYLYN